MKDNKSKNKKSEKYDKYAKQFLTNIKDCIQDETKNFTTIKSAIIHRVNEDGTVNIEFAEDGGIWNNITNQSIYQNLKKGDQVKIIQQNGILKNCWIIGVLQPTKKENILQQLQKDVLQLKEENIRLKQEINNLKQVDENLIENINELNREISNIKKML